MLAYDGTAYHGWQVQPNVVTIQGLLVAAARRLLGSDVRVMGGSRTDAGVHALRQTASLTAQATLGPEAIRGALNARLPPDIRILDVVEAELGFDARRAATGKRYGYLIDNSAIAAPLTRRFAWHVPATLDILAMRCALAPLRGLHDFSGFCAAPGREQYPVCVARSVHVREHKGYLAIVMSADRYLHHMVRNIVGSAVAVGRGSREPQWLEAVLKSRDRRLAGPTAPAHGLTLVRVLYPR